MLSQSLEIFENNSIFTLFYNKSNLFFTLNLLEFQYLEILFIFIFMFIIFYLIFIIFPSIYFIIYFKLSEFISNISLTQTLNHSTSLIPFMLSSFFFILFSNLLGLLPFSFCITGQLFLAFILSFSFVVGLTIYFNFNNYYFYIYKNVDNYKLTKNQFFMFDKYIKKSDSNYEITEKFLNLLSI